MQKDLILPNPKFAVSGISAKVRDSWHTKFWIRNQADLDLPVTLLKYFVIHRILQTQQYLSLYPSPIWNDFRNQWLRGGDFLHVCASGCSLWFNLLFWGEYLEIANSVHARLYRFSQHRIIWFGLGNQYKTKRARHKPRPGKAAGTPSKSSQDNILFGTFDSEELYNRLIFLKSQLYLSTL